ncbi:sugar-binding protein [Ruminococcus sp.]|uniref:substrate-binding domain-containing protein n=1 Tax=Ruminococcus sp. TaxID=41978 RepID=UPI0025E4F867|nr:sugar-binding protein [Ruminococcus sp.]MCR4637624.1 sugar-binding protein [Ruminococcus sp.]
MKKIIAAASAMAIACSLASCSAKEKETKETEKKTIGISMPSQSLERWNSDGSSLKAQFEKAGYSVDLRFAEDNADKQNEDISGMINDGADLLLIAAVDGNTLSDTLVQAKDKEIPVVAYDRLIMNTDALTYYVSFDNLTVGKLQGEYIRDQLHLMSATNEYNIEFVAGDAGDNNARYFFNGAYDTLKPYIDKGTLHILSGRNTFEQVATKDWTTANAEKTMKDTLASYYNDGKSLDIVLCSNDSTALGVENALDSDYKGGNTPLITGQDGDLANLANIVDGKQSMTVYKNVHDEAAVAFGVCKMLLDGSIPTSKLAESFGDIKVNYDSESYNNGVRYIQSYLLVPYVITKENLQLLVDTGVFKWDSENKYLEAAE